MIEAKQTFHGSLGAGLTRRDLGILAGAASASFAVGPALAQARRGGAANIATIGEPPTLDPMDSPADVVGMISQHMFETLYTWGEGWRIRPLLAAADPEISGDGRVYTIRVRQGVHFHDGTPMTSADVLASLNRWMTFAQRGKQTKEYVESITAPDGATIRIALVKPFAPLLSFLSLQTSAAIIIPANNQAHPMTNFVGTGTFRSWNACRTATSSFAGSRNIRCVRSRRITTAGAGSPISTNCVSCRCPTPPRGSRGLSPANLISVDALPVENAPQLKGSKAEAVIFKVFRMALLLHQRETGVPLTKCYAPSRGPRRVEFRGHARRRLRVD